MKRTCLNICIFILSFSSFIISSQLSYNLGIFADEFATSIVAMYGGNWEYLFDWVRLLFLAIIVALSGINMYYDIKRCIQNKISKNSL